ncbi:TetR/AcrR family transcriptional regulator [Eubacteriaceae bacterium ES2]|nr:TetR/AcrR family transcriptional regulator [Eubacteriaceae bacterium ES2]
MARTSKQNEQVREVSKENIRQAALKQFSEKGLSATRILDIANEAQISQGLLYRYYHSKDEIYTDLIDEALELLIQATQSVEKLDLSAKEKFLKSLDGLYETISKSTRFLQTSRLISSAMFSQAIPDEAKQKLNEKREVPYLIFAKIIKQGQIENSFVEGDPNQLSVLFWATINGLSAYVSTREGMIILPDQNHIVRMFLKTHKENEDEY